MKVFAISTFASMAYAGNMQAAFNAGLAQAKLELSQNSDRPSELRAVSDLLGPVNFQAIENYGCWCHFGDNHGKGKGAPIDSVDAMCKNLSNAYDCAMMDYAEATGNDDCVPWEVFYVQAPTFNINAVVDLCNSMNSDLCSQYACMAESSFVLNVLGVFLQGGSAINADNKIENGFDHRASCPVNSGSQTEERKCCGVLPFRYPYKPVDRECCGAVTYDPSMMSCCSDNVPAFSCV